MTNWFRQEKKKKTVCPELVKQLCILADVIKFVSVITFTSWFFVWLVFHGLACEKWCSACLYLVVFFFLGRPNDNTEPYLQSLFSLVASPSGANILYLQHFLEVDTSMQVAYIYISTLSLSE